MIFKQGKKRRYKVALGIQALRGQKSLHPGKGKDGILVGAYKACLYAEQRCKEMTDNEATLTACRGRRKRQLK